MRDTSKSAKEIQGLILSSIINLVVTFTTIAGGGWAMHREIMHDVIESQNASKAQLEDKLITILNSKLERQPTEFKIDTQSEQLKILADEIKKIQERIISIDASLKDKRHDLTFK